MATSHLVRALQIFSGAGTITVVPFTVQFANRQPKINSRGNQRLMPESDNRKEPKKQISDAEAVLKEAAKRLEKEGSESGKTGCFWLPNKWNRLDLFMCVNTQTLRPLVMFHYDWTRRDKSLDERLNEVVEVTYIKSSDIRMTFKNGHSEKISIYLTSSFAWLREWGTSMKPREHCSLSPKADGSSWHRLTCKKEGKREGFNDGVNPEQTDSRATKLKI